MAAEELPQQFISDSEIIPLNHCGLKHLEEYKAAGQAIERIEHLKKAGLTHDEIMLYQDYKNGLNKEHKIEANVLNNILATVELKLKTYNQNKDSEQKSHSDQSPTTSKQDILSSDKYPKGHPMNNIKSLEQDLFGHLKSDILPLTKRRKILRRLERKKERIISECEKSFFSIPPKSNEVRPRSLWDKKDIRAVEKIKTLNKERNKQMGPKQKTLYTIKDNKIVRLEPDKGGKCKTVDITIPINTAEERLLEGTKISMDNIRKIERFKDYEPGVPSKVLYIKNISQDVNKEQLSVLFNQFVRDNGGPIDVRLLAGRMRGQAFISFNNEDTCVRALEEINGTILGGRPLIVHFGKNSNRIQDIG